MVPLNKTFPEHFERIETNLKYLIDLDLSEEEVYNDPLALAFYYHYAEKHGIQNINKVALVSWARTYCHEKLVQQKLSRKKDTEVTAAVLAYSTLKNDKGYSSDRKQEVEEGIRNILRKEKDKSGLYFGRPNFTAIILYATNQARIALDDKSETLRALLDHYRNRQTFNNLLGLPFLARLLASLKEEAALKEVGARIEEKLKDHMLEYDDKLYLVNSLWGYHVGNGTTLKIKELVESTIKETPITLSDIINKGDISDITVRQDNLRISRLYKAVFLDMITEFEKQASGLKEEELDKRYSGEFSLKWGAFATFSMIPILITLIVGFLLRHRLLTGLAFWILQEPKKTWGSLILDSLSLILIAYLLLTSIVGSYSLYTSLARKKLARDLRVWENYYGHQMKSLKWFSISILGVIILGIITQLAGNAFQNLITRKP